MPNHDNIPVSLGSVHVFYCVFFSIGGNCRLVIATSVKTWLPILNYSSFKSICCSLKTYISLYCIYEPIQHWQCVYIVRLPQCTYNSYTIMNSTVWHILYHFSHLSLQDGWSYWQHWILYVCVVRLPQCIYSRVHLPSWWSVQPYLFRNERVARLAMMMWWMHGNLYSREMVQILLEKSRFIWAIVA